jgi:import inner membrane translocase subunit TIM21
LDKKSEDKQHHGSVVMEVLSKEEPKQLTVGAKVVQAGRDFTYLIAIVAGFGLMGFLFYSVGSEFFSSTSPSSIFTQALKRVKADERIKEILGEPITGHGEETGRGRRRHLNYLEYEVDGKTYMRMKFYVSGTKRKGEAVLDLKKVQT